VQRRWIIGLVGLVALTVIVVAIFARDREPRYQGRTLGEWLLQERLDGLLFAAGWGRIRAPEIPPATDPLQAIGTNALPFVMTWLGYRPSPLTLRARIIIPKLPARFRDSRFARSLIFTKGDRRRDAALAWVAIFGANAAAAVPELVNIINGSNNVAVTMRAITVLSYVGRDGVMPLLTCMTNQALPPMARQVAWEVVGGIPFGADCTAAVPILVSFLKNDVTDVNLAAASALGNLRLSPETVVPALAEALNDTRRDMRRTAVVALANFGPEARDAMPALMKACEEDPDPVVSATAQAAAVAIQRRSANHVDFRPEMK
jgi:HEAT repeat protein